MTSVSTVPGSFTVIVNPVAGRGRAQRVLPKLAEAAGVLNRTGADVELRVSTTPEEPTRLAAEAFARGRAVVAAGGDGLVNQLAQVAIEHGGVLGIVPLGSGNDLARALGLDHREPIAALDLLGVAGRARVRTIDVARANGRVVLTVAASGFDSEANRWANTVTRIGGNALYLTAVARTLATYRPHRFRLTLDGTSREATAWLVAVANTESYGGGMRIAPTAVCDDGLLDVTIVGPISRAGFLKTFPGVFRGRHVDHRLVETARARTVRIESLDPSLPIESYGDGEPIGPLPTEIVVEPAALRMLVPR